MGGARFVVERHRARAVAIKQVRGHRLALRRRRLVQERRQELEPRADRRAHGIARAVDAPIPRLLRLARERRVPLVEPPLQLVGKEDVTRLRVDVGLPAVVLRRAGSDLPQLTAA